ncbi:hypothetical protein CEXT_317251 [Caerostris extrusa]|uniref:Uncharacterized protein n=1 Tax=Caerostris extrusa TaxID=172846 RepID=A0AAV4P7V4_CAEEX|nr:hypothetical protein CEXT_317251 [Caerostris extrusa]
MSKCAVGSGMDEHSSPFLSVVSLQIIGLSFQVWQKFRRVVETRSEARAIPGRKVHFCSVCICMIRTRFVFVCGYGSPEKVLN